MCEAVAVLDRVSVEYASLSHEQRVDELIALQRQRAALDAAELRLLHAMHADPLPNADGSPALEKMWVREDVASVLRIAPQTATGRLHDASDVVTSLPATLAMLERGEITRNHVLRLLDGVRGLPAAIASKVENRVLRRAAQQSIGQFGASVRRAVLAYDTREVDERHQEAVAGRRVAFAPQDDGTTELWALLPAADAAIMQARLDSEAARLKKLDAAAGITRTADQRRADALAALAAATLGEQLGRHPAVNVTVALSTLLGIDEQPAEMDGHGPIPAPLARALAFDPTGTWRRLVTDPEGRLVDVSAGTYRPPAATARLVRLQHQTCCFPGCRRRAMNCELDHMVPWPHGATSPANLQPLCSRHHHLKHEAGWQPRREPDGTTTWTSPSGHTYARPPDELPRDITFGQAGDDGIGKAGDDGIGQAGDDGFGQAGDDGFEQAHVDAPPF